MLAPIKIPPGMFRNGTEYESAGRWFSGNLVRWQDRRIRPIGGWVRALDEMVLDGAARAALAWRGLTGFKYLAIGTHLKLYIGEGGDVVDETPDDLMTGRADSVQGLGFGVGPFGEGLFGTERAPSGLVLDATTWSLDTWGENLIALSASDGRIFEWVPGSGDEPAPIENAPEDCTGAIVTNERHLIALGADGNRRLVKWSDQEDNTGWTPTAVTEAGDLELQTAGNIVTGARVGSQIIVWTTLDAHVIDYLGPPFFYGRRIVGDNCGILGRNAALAIGGTAYWMGDGAFWIYDGTVKPLPCEVSDYVFGSLNSLQKAKITTGHNSRFSEIWWHYPSAGSIENDRYVIYNYKEKVWYLGELARTVWIDRGVFSYPLAADPEGVLFEQENGWLADGETRLGSVFARSGPSELGDGERIMYSDMMIPDASPNPGATQVSFITRFTPQGPEHTYGPFELNANAEGFCPIQFTGRQAALRIDQIDDSDWSHGTHRLDVRAGGKR